MLAHGHKNPFEAGLVMGAQLLLLLGCGPRLQANATSLSIPQQCGITANEPVGSYDARCIAKLAGLEFGIRRWDVRRNRTDTVDQDNWSVCNTLKPTGDSKPPGGRCVRVRISDGAVLEVYPWEAILVN